MRKLSFLAAALAALWVASAAAAAVTPKPVPSLQPEATAKLWNKLVHRQHSFARADAGCRPLRAVFYTSTDWLRLATKLAAAASPCAEYYISIPPLAADKTAFRYDQPWRIRALGPSFHVLAEINITGWTKWVAANPGAGWYDAGVEARRRMAAGGFDLAAGDTWIVNEFSSAVRGGTGNARANMRQLVKGLYDGDGGPAVKGGVFGIGFAQTSSNVADLQANLQSWFADTPFWQDMAAYVDDWSHEVYGDMRAYAVAGAPPEVRRDKLNEFLQHEVVLAGAGPEDVATARSFLQATYSPLANAAWKYDTAFGWTWVPFEQMQDYVSAQTYAMRSYGARRGLAQDHFGFAWAIKPPADLSSTDFANQSGAIADRLAAAIRDSGDLSEDAGGGACGTQWCTAVVYGAAFTDVWQQFATWAFPALGFGSAPVTLTAGTPSGPLSVQLQIGAAVRADAAPVTVTLSSSSATGGFSTVAEGPWTPTLDLTVPAGSTSAQFYYVDTTAGTPTLTAAAPGRGSATQAETVTAAPASTLAISPGSATVQLGASQSFTVTGADAYGNPVAAAPTWTLAAGTPGTISPAGVFTAGTTTTGSGTVTATSGTATASAPIVVTTPKLRVASIKYGLSGKRLVVQVSVVRSADGVPVSGASVALTVIRGTSTFFSTSATTGSDGRATVTSTSNASSGCYTTKLTRVTRSGFVWDGVMPPNQYCR